MLTPPKYFINNKISKLLAQIEANKQVIDTIKIPLEVELNIRRQSTLKSSLFSARIEGNNTLFDEYSKLADKDLKKIEINNILRAVNWIQEKKIKLITIKDILDLHSIVMKNIDFEELGKFRKKHEGIFTTAGIVVYHAPPPSQINPLIVSLLKYVNSDKEEFCLIKAVIAHYIFEKIHPFTDGSGRVGRLLILMILKSGGYGFKGILPFEEKIDKRRETYYRMLEESEKDITSYIEFMLETIMEASNEARELVVQKDNVQTEDYLLPRRAEIYRILKDHKLVNLDFIKRRFGKINERNLRNDLKKLQDLKLVQKLGTTRGVFYKLNEKN